MSGFLRKEKIILHVPRREGGIHSKKEEIQRNTSFKLTLFRRHGGVTVPATWLARVALTHSARGFSCGLLLQPTSQSFTARAVCSLQLRH